MPVELWVIAWGYLPQCDRIRASHVCTAWRTLMLSTPRLWTHLHLKIVTLAQEDGGQRVSTTESAIPSLFRRSKSHPISFTVEILESGVPSREEYLSIARRSLELVAHRVQNLRIICDEPSNVAAIINELGEDLEQLQTLACERVEPREWLNDDSYAAFYTPQGNDMAAVPFYNAWDAFPCHQLRNVEFSPPTAFMWWPSTTQEATLEQLTSLEFIAYEVDDIRRAVRACPNLGALTLHTRSLPSFDRDPSPDYSEETDWYSGSCGRLQTIVAHAPRSFCIDFLSESTRTAVELYYVDHHEGDSEEYYSAKSAPFNGLIVLAALHTDGSLIAHIDLDDQILRFGLEDSTTGRMRTLQLSLHGESWSHESTVQGFLYNFQQMVINQAGVEQLDVAFASSSCPDMVCAVLNGLFIRQERLSYVRHCKLAIPPGFAWIEPFRKFSWLKSLRAAEELIFDDGAHVHLFDGASSFVEFLTGEGIEQPKTPERKTNLELKEWLTDQGDECWGFP